MITVGYLVGDELEWVARVLHAASHWLALGVFLLLAGLWFFFRQRQQNRSAT
jgi:LPXTG-motif cell wall-anchored protein